MANERKIKAILFDSGKVLNGPATGEWFIPPKFFEYVDEDKYKRVDSKKLQAAFKKANKYINSQKIIETTDEEFTKFIEFYKIFANEIPELDLNDDDTENIAHDLVYNTKKYKFYDDVIDTLKELKENYKLGVVSDAWPSLKNVFKDAGLYEYFDTFIISSILGVTKPDQKMFESALDELSIKPENAVFIDDNIKNCKGAVKLGIHSFWLCRDEREYRLAKMIIFSKKLEPIRNLSSIKNSKVFS